MVDQRFPKAARLLTRGDFRRVYERRVWVADDLLRAAGELNDLGARGWDCRYRGRWAMPCDGIDGSG